jgi:hypothetical protein
MLEALRPGGTLLIANIAGFISASMPHGPTTDSEGRRSYYIDRYLDERCDWVSWRGMRNHGMVETRRLGCAGDEGAD